MVNQTSEPLTIRGDELRPDGGEWNHGFQGCSRAALDVLDGDGDGEEYVQIDAGWCDGEIWTITGPGEVSVEDHE
ncbi:hypothetical protein IEZ26_13920 [Nocardioides cavernae]|uniref:Uncharacterized protein n=1 Tax=Nocardioides cavernae TaxID=1921566 RepID=A0ABR8NDI1_9ACTN|nr:hypothetical protein [Nocardioides cavernae]MBD3925726.1 hypothetical protein [Nocardioides cavernae]MBM7513311.1 hypothetical protein [Nocardioides cavernae]